MSIRSYFYIIAISLFCTACGHRQTVSRIPVPAPPPCCKPAEKTAPPVAAAPTDGKRADANKAPEKVQPQSVEVGYASWYGNPYHGRRAANGEIYDMNKLTAAHLTLPFGTQIKVTDIENNRSVKVRIIDRGPFVKGRILDLSLAAAKQIQMVGPGTALVRIEVLSVPAEPDFGSFAVQVGAFRDRASADKLRDRLNRRFGNVSVETFQDEQGTVYRVRVGPKPSLSQATQLAGQLNREMLRTFVVRLDN
jgi:rare lipoprotein A